MRKLQVWILLALLTATIFSTIRPSGVLHSAPQTQPGAKPANVPPGETQKKDPGGYQIRTDVSFVTTDVTIIGKIPPNLSKEDFVIYDNGVAQPADYFSLDQLPLAIAILIDASESIRPFLSVLQHAAVSALRRLKPEDKVVLYQFNRNADRLTDLTDNRLLILDQITRVRIAGCTNISDTLYLSAEYLAQQARDYRRAVILISDNEATSGSTGAGQMLGCSVVYDMAQARNELLEDNATLFNIRATIDDPSIQQNQARLAPWIISDQEILLAVGATGGEQFRVNSAALLSQALGESITKLRKQITLGFYPTSSNKPGVFHKLTVNFANANRCPGCQIHSRSGYYSGVASSNPPPPTANKTSSSYNEQVDEAMLKIMIEDILSENIDLNDIPFNVETTPQTDAKGKPELKLNLKIQFDQVDSPIKNNKHQCKVRVWIFYGKDAAGFAGSREAKISGGLNDDQYNKFMKEGIPLSINVPLVDKKQKMKVIVYDETSDRTGCKTIHYAAPK
jgi:VWFA-related protein